jgi:hypothetical protein
LPAKGHGSLFLFVLIFDTESILHNVQLRRLAVNGNFRCGVLRQLKKNAGREHPFRWHKQFLDPAP